MTHTHTHTHARTHARTHTHTHTHTHRVNKCRTFDAKLRLCLGIDSLKKLFFPVRPKLVIFPICRYSHKNVHQTNQKLCV